MLNQTDVGNNNNKYYLIQCLESDNGGNYYCWQVRANEFDAFSDSLSVLSRSVSQSVISSSSVFPFQRWGRVGKIAGTNLVQSGGNKESAKSTFTKKFQDKTKNRWEDRDDFCKVAGKYDLLQMDYSPSADDVKPETGVKEEVVEKKEVESQLDASIQARTWLMEINMLASSVAEAQKEIHA